MAPENPKPANQWFLLDASGNRNGPFTLEELQKQVRDGKISQQQRVTAEHLAGQSLTVAAALEHLHPAHTLFHTLQTAKQLKQRSVERDREAGSTGEGPKSSGAARRSRVAWVVGSLVLAGAVVAIWLLRHRPSGPASSSGRVETVKSNDTGPPQFTTAPKKFTPPEKPRAKVHKDNPFLAPSRPAARPEHEFPRMQMLRSIPNLRDPTDPIEPPPQPDSPDEAQRQRDDQATDGSKDAPEQPADANPAPDPGFTPASE